MVKSGSLGAALLASAWLGCGGSGAPDGMNLGSLVDGGSDGMAPAGPLCSSAPADLATSQRRARSCAVGSEAALLLRAQPYSKVVVEINATTGLTPRQAAIDHLRQVFADVTHKPGGVTVRVGDSVPAAGHPLTLAEVRALEDAHRTQFPLGDTAVFYFLVVSDPSADDTKDAKVLGLAHRASSMVVFQGTIDSISGGLGQPSRDVVESTVVAHELGHILGLVHLGTPMVQPHEDSAHPGHDSNDKCLMYWANNSSQLLGNLLGGGTVVDFDAQCKADLAAVRDAAP